MTNVLLAHWPHVPFLPSRGRTRSDITICDLIADFAPPHHLRRQNWRASAQEIAATCTFACRASGPWRTPAAGSRLAELNL